MNALPLKENLEKFTRMSTCPVRNIISRFSGKWSMLVLCILAENETTRFNELGRSMPDISPKVLSETLKNLEADGIVSRKLYAEVPPRVEYSLTAIGRSLMPHLLALIGWGAEYFDEIMHNRKKYENRHTKA